MPYAPQLGNDPIDDAIESFLHLAGSTGGGEQATSDTDLYREILQTLTRLIRDRPDRLEIKIINSALKELRYAFKVFRDYRDRQKVTIFGSARIKPNDEAYKTCAEFASKMAENGWMAITGAGPGIMEAGIQGAGIENSFGVAIRLPFESANTMIDRDKKLINFKYFFTRKLLFMKEASAVVLLPGGFGTMDEGFEALTLIQTGKANPVPVVLLDTPESDYWEMWRLFIRKELLNRGLISKEDQSLYYITKDADDAVAHILEFYKNYHSLRYVRDKTVMRVKKQPSAELLDDLNKTFSGMLVDGGRYVASGPLPDELANEEPAVLALPRIVFPFTRKAFGRLREIVDRVNED